MDSFWLSLLQIVMIDIILGADNSIVIAMACRNIPQEMRNKAIFWGTAGAVIVRVIMTVLIVLLLKIKFLQLIGGLLLIWIAYKLLVGDEGEEKIEAKSSLRGAIQTIIYADIIMGMDNMLAIGGASKGNFTLVILGLLISIPIIVWGSKIILHFLERFPMLIYVGAGILAYTAGEMIVRDPAVADYLHAVPYLPYVIVAILVVSVLSLGHRVKTRREAKKVKAELE
ncbi:MAG: TerC family protein [Bacillaceae bacterium]|nr:TerC family protein [Bacillaceae bacterium]